MSYIKLYMIKVLVVFTVIQLCGIMIKKDSFKKTYRLVSGVVILITFFSFSLSDFEFEYSSDYSFEVYSEDQIKERFVQDISEIIKNDVNSAYGVSCAVSAQTNYESITFYVSNIDNRDKEPLIKEYIKNKYCTDFDGVYIINEHN